MLHETSSRSAQEHTELPATHTFYTRKGRATPANLHPQSSTAVTYCLLIATHFTNPRKDDSLCQARKCHRELKPGHWRKRRVCYHTATYSHKVES